VVEHEGSEPSAPETVTPEVVPKLVRKGRRPSVPFALPTDPKERLHLPDPQEWRTFFPPQKHKDRISISNPDTAALLAEAFVPKGSKDKVIIEAFPGPGALTRALLNLPKERIRKLIVIEDHEKYLDYIRPLADLDPRLVVITNGGFAWDSYQLIEDSGLLDDVKVYPWDAGLHPHLQFISHLPLATMGEQFAAQTLRCIPDQTWLFKFGRVPVNFILSEWVWSRFSATLEEAIRCKLTIIAEATAQCKMALGPDKMLPYDDHFHPTVSKSAHVGHMTDNRRIGTPFVAVEIKPLKRQAIGKGMLDKWDYCLRRLFVMKSTPLKKAISHLAPGAETLIRKVTKDGRSKKDRIDVTKTIRMLTVDDWAVLLKAFDEWPFAPEDLMVSDGFIQDSRKLD